MHEAHGQHRQLAGVLHLRALHHLDALVGELDFHGDQRAQVALAVAQELLGHHAVRARVLAEDGADLPVAVVHAEDLGPLRPGVARRALVGRPRQQLQVQDALAPVAHAGADAVRARVPAADDHHVLALRRHEALVPAALQVALLGEQQPLLVLGEELHREVHALELAPRDRQVPRLGGPDGEHEGVVGRAEVVDVHVHPHVGAGDELDALLAQQLHAALHGLLLQLHVGDAVHEQAAHAVRPLVHRHLVAHLVELVGGGEARGPAAHHGHAHARAERGHARRDPPLLPRPVHDGVLDVLDGDGLVHQAGHAAALAGRRAHAARELREVVGLVQPVVGVPPLALVHQLVPLGDQVVDRAPGVRLAEGRPAVHAPSCLNSSFDAVVAR
mmetsp:Transcript_25281/g.39870  ORF Transcript_25281/g.39870 Transcript_25281/m.39870 type:complete len:387 (+) Transcript_25281:614-1774(+)